jgi:hypothetical protein
MEICIYLNRIKIMCVRGKKYKLKLHIIIIYLSYIIIYK